MAQPEKNEEFTHPTFPDDQFEKDLRSFISTTWPNTKFHDELEDEARSVFYEDHVPHVVRCHVPMEDIRRAFRFAMAKLEECGFTRC